MRKVSLPKGILQLLSCAAFVVLGVLNNVWQLGMVYFAPWVAAAIVFFLSGVIDLTVGVIEHKKYLKKKKDDEDPFKLRIERVEDKPVRGNKRGVMLGEGCSQYKNEELLDDNFSVVIEEDEKGNKKVTTYRKTWEN